MDGTLTIIDGQPGRGKTLAAVELMLDSIRRGRPVATNIALKPLFTTKAIRINPAAIVMQLAPEEIKTYWQHTPANCDIYIDEAHLIWGSEEFRANRQGNFKSYISQFRKDGDSIYLMAQHFENLDKFIRQRAETVIRCGRISWPKFLPTIGGKPIVFSINYYKVEEGDLGDRRNLIPRLFTPGMRKGIYQYYDTRGKVWTGDTEHETLLRPTIETLRGKTMPTILTENAQGTQPIPGTTTQSLVTINQNQPEKKKRYWPWIFAAGIMIIIILSLMQSKSKKQAEHKSTTREYQQTATTNQKIQLYGRIGRAAYLRTKTGIRIWKIGAYVGKIQLLGIGPNGAIFRLPRGMYQTIPYYRKPKPKPHKNKHSTGFKP